MKSYISCHSLFLVLIISLSKAIPSMAQDRDRERDHERATLKNLDSRGPASEKQRQREERREVLARESLGQETDTANGLKSDEERQKLREKRKAHRERVRDLSSEDKQFLREERLAQKEGAGEDEGGRRILNTDSEKRRFKEERKAERQKIKNMSVEELQKYREERLADRKKEKQVFDERRADLLNGGDGVVKPPLDKKAMLKAQLEAQALLDDQMARLAKVINRKQQQKAQQEL